MHPVAQSFILTATLAITDIFMKAKKKLRVYIILFLALTAVNYIFRSDLHASQYLFGRGATIESVEELEFMIHMCEKNAIDSYNKAINTTILSLRGGDKDKAKALFGVIIVGCAPNTPLCKAAAMAMAIAQQFVFDAWQNYDDAMYHFHIARYHAEMHEFYSDMLKYINSGGKFSVEFIKECEYVHQKYLEENDKFY